VKMIINLTSKFKILKSQVQGSSACKTLRLFFSSSLLKAIGVLFVEA